MGNTGEDVARMVVERLELIHVVNWLSRNRLSVPHLYNRNLFIGYKHHITYVEWEGVKTMEIDDDDELLMFRNGDWVDDILTVYKLTKKDLKNENNLRWMPL